MRELLRHAADLGVTVHIAHLPDGYLGGWYPEEQRIYLGIGLTPCETRCVLAHELGHVYYGHTCDDDRAETQADVYAARLLIDPAAYARAERLTSTDVDLAEELGVTLDVLHTYRARCLTRLRGVSYVRPRHGAGQWSYRA